MSERNPHAKRPLRRSGSGRTPQWVHDEEVRRLVRAMHGEKDAATPPDGWPIRGRAKRKLPKRQDLARAAMTFCVVLTLFGVSAWYVSPDLVTRVTTGIVGEQFRAPISGAVLADSDRWSAGYPPRGGEAQKSPLGEPAPLPVANDSYRFIGGNGALVAYDPCRPIHYVTRPDHAPPGGQKLITDAVAAASAATGLVFVDDGLTTEGYDAERKVHQPDRYGKRWAPVLIVWETPQEEPRFVLKGEAGGKHLAGLGGSQSIVGDAGSMVFVTGTVQLSSLAFTDILAGPDGAAMAGGIVQHELGHVLGLGHVQDPQQLMYEHGQNSVTSYAPGDLTGLAQLGRGECFPNH